MSGMITLVYPYYENGGMLERHLREWNGYSRQVKKIVRVIIVDDGSPKDPAAKHVRDVGFQLELYRIKQNLVWNVAGARNLGMEMAPEGWCLLTDIDHLLDARAADNLAFVHHEFNPGRFYTMARRWADGRPLHPHPNSFIIERELYWHIGGCDEDWTGWWGAGEQVFRKSLHAKARGLELGSVYLTHFGRDDIASASTTEWGRRDSKFDWKKNPALVAKAKRAPYKPENPLRFDWERIPLPGLDHEHERAHEQFQWQ